MVAKLELAQIPEIVESRMAHIIKEEVSKNILNFRDCLAYAVLGGGKKIRSKLLIASSKTFNANFEKAVDCSCALEFIHGASLVLDDLPSMDNANFRRSKKTLHRVYGEGQAILSSAALYTMAFNTISKIGHSKIAKIIEEVTESIGSNGLIAGQYIDINNMKEMETKIKNKNDLFDMYYLKTGLLFTCAIKIGALLGDASKQEIRLLNKVGRDVGIAYQIRDDLLDCRNFEQTGKDANKDKENGKITSVSLLGKKEAEEEFKDLMNGAKKNLDKIKRDTSQILEIINFIENG